MLGGRQIPPPLRHSQTEAHQGEMLNLRQRHGSWISSQALLGEVRNQEWSAQL